MAGIAGIAATAGHEKVAQMLDKLRHRGRAGSAIEQLEDCTLGVTWSAPQACAAEVLRAEQAASDDAGTGMDTEARVGPNGLVLQRDLLGIRPLYYGHTTDGALCFASEVKALLEVTRRISLLPPGNALVGEELVPYFQFRRQPSLSAEPEELATKLRGRLETAVGRLVANGEVGSWLSGGLDSSAIAAIAKNCVPRLHSFAVGLDGAPDLEFARLVADHIGSQYHQVVLSREDLVQILPQVIYYLESFDALLVRSSLTNYFAGRLAADYVPAILSGEAGDELFAGYEYLKQLNPEVLPDELVDITNRLHNTAFQRVDRCASAHGLVALVPFADPDVVDLASRIPAEYKLHDGIEKWILRVAMSQALPEKALWRPKAKFWEGAGVGEVMAGYAEDRISDGDFSRERTLPNGWRLNSKEELLYYRLFREHFGEFQDLAWMGRTKGAPVA